MSFSPYVSHNTPCLVFNVTHIIGEQSKRDAWGLQESYLFIVNIHKLTANTIKHNTTQDRQ